MLLIQTLPDWPVLRWMPKPDFTVNQASLRAKGLVIFIDDVQNYASAQSGGSEGTIITADPRATTPSTGLETLRQEVECVVVVATCRLEDEDQVKAGLGKLYSELMVIPIELDIKDDSKVAGYIAQFQRYDSSHVRDWDGTLGSLVLGLSTKNHEYLKIRDNPAATILQAMKLLTRTNTLIHTESLLQVVCADVFGEKEFLEEKKNGEML